MEEGGATCPDVNLGVGRLGVRGGVLGRQAAGVGGAIAVAGEPAIAGVDEPMETGKAE